MANRHNSEGASLWRDAPSLCFAWSGHSSRRAGATFAQLDHFEVAQAGVVHGEAHEGAHAVPPLQAGGAGVDVEQAERAVVLHLQDVRVARDEEPGRSREEHAADAAVVMAGIAADVLHEHVGGFAAEAQHDGEEAAQVAAVAVAAHGTERAEGGEAFGHLERADVARVPYLVTLGEVLRVAVVPVSVRVGEQAYSFHPVGVGRGD